MLTIEEQNALTQLSLPPETGFVPFVLITKEDSSLLGTPIKPKIGLIPMRYTGDPDDFHEFLQWLTDANICYDSLVLMKIRLIQGHTQLIYCSRNIFEIGWADKINPAVLDSLQRKQFKSPVFHSLQLHLLRLYDIQRGY